MIQVLDRAFTIIEQVALAPRREHSLSELAATLGIRASTCANIVRSLVDSGYLESSGPRRGYRLGPVPYLLARRAPYAADLTDAAKGEMEALCKELNETCVLSVLRGIRRHVLLHVRHDSPLQIRQDVLLLEDPYRSPSGRLLVALLPVHERDRLVKRLGPPGDAWPEADTRSALERTCASIRQQGCCLYVPDDGDALAGVACPVVHADGYAALGVFLPRYRFKAKHKRKILMSLRDTSDYIGRRVEETA